MPTVIAFECDGGAVLAADRAVVRDGRLVSDRAERVRGFDGHGAAVLDDPTTVLRELDAALRQYRTERGDPGLAAFASLVRDAVADRTDAALAARDDGGTARVRVVAPDGETLDDDCHARGTGAELALGRLEAADREVDTGAAADLARDALADVAERDPATVEAVDVWTLPSA